MYFIGNYDPSTKEQENNGILKEHGEGGIFYSVILIFQTIVKIVCVE